MVGKHVSYQVHNVWKFQVFCFVIEWVLTKKLNLVKNSISVNFTIFAQFSGT